MDASGYSGQHWNVNRRISKQETVVDVSGRESLELGVRGALVQILLPPVKASFNQPCFCLLHDGLTVQSPPDVLPHERKLPAPVEPPSGER